MNAFVILMIGAGVLIVLLAGIVGMRGWRRRDRSGGIVNPPPGYYGGNTDIHTAQGMGYMGHEAEKGGTG